jgi:hypothetical protein
MRCRGALVTDATPCDPSSAVGPDEGSEVELDGARVAVTGGAGFLGSHLCDALLAPAPR